MQKIKYDPILETLMGPGGAFEVADAEIDGRTVRVFSGAPETLSSFINQGRAHADKTFIVEPGLRLTFSEYYDRVDQFAAHLKAREECPPGSVVALAARNSAAWMIAFSAIVLSGRIPALINSRSLGATMQAALEDGDAQVLVADEKRLSQLRDAGCQLPAISLDGKGGGAADIALGELLQSTSSRPVSELEGNAGDVAVLMYTSGTTGRAKAAALSNRSMVLGVMNVLMARRAILERMAAAYNIELSLLQSQMPQGSSLLIFPLFHTSGCSALFLSSLLNGDKLVLLPRWEITEAFRAIEEEKVTAMTAVPTMLWDILKAPNRADFDLSSLRSFSSGGQAIPIPLLNSLREAYPEGVFGTGYGMTEVNGSVGQAIGEEFLSRPDAAGRVLPMADIKVVDENEQDLPQGSVGELWVRSATLMNGYKLGKEINRPFKDGGWYATGDIGRVDEEGYIYIVDRKTDMVISGGENIYCAEVEQALSGVDGVKELAAFGVPDDRLGEKVILAVVSEMPAEKIGRAIADKANKNLATYKQPKDIHVRSEALPRNAMDKIEKHRVREDYFAVRTKR